MPIQQKLPLPVFLVSDFAGWVNRIAKNLYFEVLETKKTQGQERLLAFRSQHANLEKAESEYQVIMV